MIAEFEVLGTQTCFRPKAIRQQMIITIAAEWDKEDAYLHPLLQAFDAADTPAIFNLPGCSIILE